MKDDKDKKDDLTEEDIKELLESLKENDQSKRGVIFNLGLLLHPKMTCHILVTYILNLIVFAVISGILNKITPTVEFTLTSYFIGVTLFTLMEFVLKIITLKFFLRTIIYSFGVILFILQILEFYLTALIVKDFSFYTTEGLLIFTICFSFIRLIITRYIRKYRILDFFGKR